MLRKKFLSIAALALSIGTIQTASVAAADLPARAPRVYEPSPSP